MLLSTIKKHIILAGALLTFAALCFLSPTMARAEKVPLDQIPLDGSWATGCGIYSAGQNIRVSRPPTITNGYLDYRNQTIQATAGDTIDLEVVIYTTSCRPDDKYYPLGTGNYISNIQIDGGATVSPSLAGTIAIIGYNSNVFSIETYRIAIRVTIPANLPTGTKTFTIGLNGGEKINLFKNGVYQCVKNDPRQSRNGYDNPLYYYGCEPGPASLSFNVNVQAAIQPTYTGAIQINKRDSAGSTYVGSTVPGNSSVGINNGNNGNGPSWNPNGTSNPFSTSGVYVNPGNVNSNEQKSGSLGSYNSYIDIPSGYRLNRYSLSLSNFKPAIIGANDTPILNCDKPEKTGRCTVSGVRVANNDTTYVDWYLEKIPPTLTVNCTPDNGAIGGKITVTASSPLGTNTVDIKQGIDINPPTETQDITGSYTFDIASKYRDGGVHTYYATYDGLSKQIAFGPGQTCNIDKWFYPWLQTSQGDVVADGKIEGQTTSTGTAGTLGARLDNATAKEAEFLVISAVGGGGPFCSTYKYILTNTSSQGTNCGNGLGYNFNSTGIDNATVDRVIGGVKQAFADNGNSTTSATNNTCSANGIATATVTTMPASISTTCPGGVIYKLSSGTLGRTVLLQGRATIFVDGPLTITDDLLANRAQVDPRLAPALAIVVTGNINIAYNASADGISYIDAQLYSAEKINTCTTSAGNLATTNQCSIPLKVVGSLSAKKGFEFKRTYVEPSNLAVYREPAESIKMTGMHLAFPPPGIDSRYFYNNFSSYKLDSAEYNPRF